VTDRAIVDRAVGLAAITEALEAAYRTGWEDSNRWGLNLHHRRESIDAEARRLLAKLEKADTGL